jgi:hypothetical protein
MKFLLAIRLRCDFALAVAGSFAALTGPGSGSLAAATPRADPITLEDVAARCGINFVLRNSATPARRPPLDKPDPSYNNRLYRNNGDGSFTDVTLAAVVLGDGFGTGVSAADFDNDGWEDFSSPA